MKRILVLSGSPRKKGNSDILCDEFVKGASEAGNEVLKISMAEKNVAPCRACYYCTENDGKCVIKDDMSGILDELLNADVVVLASPVYFYSMCAQLKAVIDRTVAKWLEIKNKEFYFIVTAAEEGDHVTRCTLDCMQGLVDCLEGSSVKGIVKGVGVYEKGDITGHPEIMSAAYDMGKHV